MSAPTTTAPWTKAFAKATDAELSHLYDVVAQTAQAAKVAAERAINAAPTTTHPILDSRGRRTYKSYRSLDGGQSAVTIEQVRALADKDDRLVAALAALELATADAADALQAARDYDRTNYAGWQRFFLVPGGHIHASRACHSLKINTLIGWLPELSGETEAEAVAAHGAWLCTHCFPTAPVEWTDGRSAEDDKFCAGGGTWDYPRETARMGYCAGNYGVCSHCGEKITITSTGKMRKHQKPGA